MSKRKKREQALARSAERTIDGLVARGLVTRTIVNGEPGVELTAKGRAAVAAADRLQHRYAGPA